MYKFYFKYTRAYKLIFFSFGKITSLLDRSTSPIQSQAFCAMEVPFLESSSFRLISVYDIIFEVMHFTCMIQLRIRPNLARLIDFSNSVFSVWLFQVATFWKMKFTRFNLISGFQLVDQISYLEPDQAHYYQNFKTLALIQAQ